MNRYTLIDYDTAPVDVRELYDDYLRSTGSTSVPIWVRSLGASPDLLRAYWERTKGSLLRGNLPLLLKEMIIFVVSVENGSRYCSAAHAHAVLSLDKTLTFENLSALTGLGDAGLDLPQSFRAALDFAILATRDANAVPDRAFEALEDADFSRAEIHELQAVIDLAKMFNSYTSSLRLPIDPDYRPVLEPLAS